MSKDSKKQEEELRKKLNKELSEVYMISVWVI